MTEFVPFPKIARWSRDIIITEKIDGTNAQVHIDDTGTIVTAGSRTRWITPESDNFGFARWVAEHHDELLKLGPGSHFGEWYGAGIQRNYGLKEKRFALFNTHRWGDAATRPACCGVVPVLCQGMMSEQVITDAMRILVNEGSRAVPGFMKPEGIVIFHTAASALFKKTLEGDEKPKGSREAS